MLRWPLREALLCLRERMRERALDAYRHEVMVWAVFRAAGGKGRAPEPPKLLKD